MRNPIHVLKSLEEKASVSNNKYERLYRNLYNPEFYLLAYANIAKSQGSMTQGVDGQTLDNMSLPRINRIIEGQDFWGMMFVFAEAALSSMVGQAKRQNAPSTIPVNCLSHSMIRFTASFSPRKLRYRNRMGNSCLSAVNLFCDSQIWKSFLPTMRNCGESATTMELPAIFINCATFPISWNTVASKPSQVSINAP